MGFVLYPLFPTQIYDPTNPTKQVETKQWIPNTLTFSFKFSIISIIITVIDAFSFTTTLTLPPPPGRPLLQPTPTSSTSTGRPLLQPTPTSSTSTGRPLLQPTPTSSMPTGRLLLQPTPTSSMPTGFGSVHWGLMPPQQPGSYQGGEMMMKSVIWWRKPEYPEETTNLRPLLPPTPTSSMPTGRPLLQPTPPSQARHSAAKNRDSTSGETEVDNIFPMSNASKLLYHRAILDKPGTYIPFF